MNITYKIDKIKKNNWLNVAFDVSKDSLHMYTETGDETIVCISDSFANNTEIIFSRLKDLKKLALRSGYSDIHIVCEPSGVYEQRYGSGRKCISSGYEIRAPFLL